jgi:hypothetical protein
MCWKVNFDSREVNVVLKWLLVFIHVKPTFTSFLDFPYTNASLLSLATPCYCLIVSESQFKRRYEC